MITSYKLMSALLDYPRPESRELLDEATAIAASDPGMFDRRSLADLRRFVGKVGAMTLTQWQTRYVELFDCSTPTTLYLFDHVYGSSRQRGMAMVDLIEMYESKGVEISSGELPDYLPVFLEFLSMAGSRQEAADFLAETTAILRSLHKRLKDAGEPYALLVAILLRWAAKGNPQAVAATVADHASGDPGPTGCEGCAFNQMSNPANTNES